MHYLLIALILAGIAITALYGMGRRTKRESQPRDSLICLYKGAAYSRADVVKKLRVLARYQRPQERPVVTATCYMVIRDGPGDSVTGKPVIRTVNYVCTTCGGKTVYREQDLPYDFDLIRGQANSIPNIKVTPLEQEFCRHCSPRVKHPYLGLKINYPGTSDSSVIRGATGDDLRLIANFMKGDYSVLAGDERQKQDNIARLEKLLGVRIDQ
ncbi:MAG: hypothetical protein MUF78_09305 [Candidatus Edwardsbacteria bacterium]|jgi:hypothetical protein|nr:hypothetical protein [Candidatus Edwardsbacteria bacterium]